MAQILSMDQHILPDAYAKKFVLRSILHLRCHCLWWLRLFVNHSVNRPLIF